MNPYLWFRAARIVLLLLLGAVFLSLGAGRPLGKRPRMLILGVLLGAVLSFPNFGFFHALQWGPVHYWDTFHYFMGAKYLPELGYSGLYEATFVAGRELGAFEHVGHVRDLMTYALQDVGSIDRDEVRRRFSEERWDAFKHDLAFFGRRIALWPLLFRDHGYNDPPARALLLHGLVGRLPANVATIALITSLDYVLLALAYLLARSAFGTVPAALAFASLLLSFFARFDFIGGTFLRWDWIAAVLVGLAAFARGSGIAAGILLAYAALARIFPVLFLVPLAIKWAQNRVWKTPDATLTRCLATAAGCLLTAGVVLAAWGARSPLPGEYVAKMAMHSQMPSINAVGLGSLIALHSAPWSLGPDGTVYIAEAALAASRPAPWIAALAASLCLSATAPLILRARPLESVMYAVPLVFFALSPSGYYYSFLVLLVLLPWRDEATDAIRLIEMAFLALTMAVSYAFELVSEDLPPLFYAVSIQMALFFLVWLVFEYVRLGARGTRRVSVAMEALGSTARSSP